MYMTIRLSRLMKYLFAAVGFILLISAIGAVLEQEEPDTVAVLAQQTPQEVLIIDPGHGGEDGGAVAPDGTKESEINLDIAQRIDALSRFCGVPTVMTRTSDMIEYPDSARTTASRKAADQKARVALINAVEHGILLSVHQNKYPASGPRGPQVFYAATEGSRQLGELTQQTMTDVLYPQNIRTAIQIPSSIYLMKHVRCPAILVECGFLSNPAECALLQQADYRLKTAVVLTAACVQYSSQSRSA